MKAKCLTLLTVPVLLLAACAAEDPSDSPYRAEFDRAMLETDSQFQRDILADYVITDAEYQWARERLLRCLADAGITAELTPDGGYVVQGAESAHRIETDRQCNQDSVTAVQSLYRAMHENPDNRGYFELAKECLLRAQLIDASVSEATLEQLFNTVSQLSDVDRAGYTLPGGTSVDDPAVIACYLTPSG